MRFAKLSLESFQSIERADVEFGPALNVLYGPNDLGKSTLAAAIRAALLVPPTSTEAERYSPWHSGATPRVSLTFVDAENRYWKVSKAFGQEKRAELLQSKDGVSFVMDVTARQVEEKIRQLLRWGIPAPGGRGGPKGMPTSFLANTLLAAQTDVDAILGNGLEGDLEDSGKQQLGKALETLARDPLFKKVLDEAQREVDAFFTATGRRKTGQGSRFTAASDEVKKLGDEREALDRQVAESVALENRVSDLRKQREAARVRVADAAVTLEARREGLNRSRTREQAAALLAAATKSLDDIDAHARRVAALASALDTLKDAMRAREDADQQTARETLAAEEALRAAEEAHRNATGKDGARRRELKRAQLSEQSATLVATRQRVEAEKQKLEAIIASRAGFDSAANRAQCAKTDAESVSRRLADARERLADVEGALKLARAVLAYGRWRAATSALEEASNAKAAAEADRAAAEAREAEATALDARARDIDADVEHRAKGLPGEAEIVGLGKLERELEVAEAALGGGIRVTVRPKRVVSLRVVADHADTVPEAGAKGEHVVEAERRVHVSLADIADIEVVAGRAEQRRAAEEARARWAAEGAPVVIGLGAKSVAQVAKLRAEVLKEMARAAELRNRAESERGDARGLRDRAAMHEERALRVAISPEEMEEKRAAIGPTGRDALAKQFAKLGKAWESQAEAAVGRCEKDARIAQAEVTEIEKGLELRGYQASEAQRAAQEAEEASNAILAGLNGADPQALLQKAKDDLSALSRSEVALHTEIQALEAEGTVVVGKATTSLEGSRERLRVARARQETAKAALEAARADWNARTGEHGALVEQLRTMNRAGAVALVEERTHAFDALAGAPTVDEADVAATERSLEQAHRDLESAQEELHRAEGALSKVGGATVREELARIDEALAAARERERNLEVDADAWKLLRATLVEVEKRDGAHLGRALAAPVTARFAELTGSRYGNLRLDQALKTEGVDAAGLGAPGADVLGALSVGTRNQLATIIRLTIADQLKSAIILDDHLVHTDPTRLVWFRDALRKTAHNAQVVVLTCRPEDYLSKEDLSGGAAIRDLGGGSVRAINFEAIVGRRSSPSALPRVPEPPTLVEAPSATAVRT